MQLTVRHTGASSIIPLHCQDVAGGWTARPHFRVKEFLRLLCIISVKERPMLRFNINNVSTSLIGHSRHPDNFRGLPSMFADEPHIRPMLSQMVIIRQAVIILVVQLNFLLQLKAISKLID